jgi:AcrR family transcriptional regulator
MTSQPVQKRGVATRQSLLDAGRAEFKERGWEGATVRGVVDRAGVSTGTFYRYFTDMSQLLYEIAAHRYEELRERVQLSPDAGGDPTESLTARCRRLMLANCQRIYEYHRGEHGLHNVLTERRYHDAELDRLARQSDEALLSQSMQLFASLGIPERDAAHLAFVVFHLLESTIVALATAKRARAPQPVFEVLADMVTGVVIARSNSRGMQG